MPLNKYGVLIGSKTDYYRDPLDNFGKFYHGNVKVSANGVEYRCAIDVDSKNSNTGVEWRIINLTATDLGAVSSMSNGWHLLTSNSASGAIDYIRSPFMAYYIWIRIPLLTKFRIRIPIWMVVSKRVIWQKLSSSARYYYQRFFLHPSFFWNRGNSIQAVEDLESVLSQGTEVYIFGEFFNSGNGVHDIHQNQGDPLSSQWAASNGIWQDGATIVKKADGTFVGFFNKFTSQSYFTDNQGHPK